MKKIDMYDNCIKALQVGKTLSDCYGRPSYSKVRIYNRISADFDKVAIITYNTFMFTVAAAKKWLTIYTKYTIYHRQKL